MSLITLGNPIFSILLIFIPILIIFYILSKKKNNLATIKFSSIGLIKSATKKHLIRENLEFILLVLGILILILALIDPHIPLKQTKEGVNVILSMDISGSMKATDYSPNRLEAAKKSAEKLLTNLQQNDHAGIVIFSNGATTSSYLSPFKDKVIQKLRGIISNDGATAIGDGLALAIDMATSIPNKKKVVVLLSDGANNAGVISPDEAIQYAKTNKIQVHVIALGSDSNVVLGYDWFGRPVYADLDEEQLKKIAKETNGNYYKSVNEKTLDDIYKNISQELEREKEPTSIKNYLIGFAIIILIIQIYISYGKYRILGR